MPWLPQPAEWKNLTAQAQEEDPGSMLQLYRTALRLRRALPALGAGTGMTWLPSPPGVLCYQRGAGQDAVTVLVNVAARPVPLRPHSEVLLSSGPLPGGQLPPDTAAWLRPPAPVPGP